MNKLKSIVFGLLTITMLAVFLTSCEKETFDEKNFIQESEKLNVKKDIEYQKNGQNDCTGNIFENVNCHNPNEENKTAVVKLYIGLTTVPNAQRECTGTLINNTSQDKRPLIITARHCACGLEIGTESPNSYIRFNYEENCTGGAASNYTDLQGLTLLAYDEKADMALLEMSEQIPSSLNTYFAGWDRSSSIPQSTYSIHHPEITGPDYKKYCEDNDAPVSYDGSAYFDNTGCAEDLDGDGENEEYTINNVDFYEVDFDLGTTTVGSSGSPLFNQNDMIVGTNYGKLFSNSCVKHYGRFKDAWDVFDDFLCPTGNCPTVLPGIPNTGQSQQDLFITNQAVSNVSPSVGTSITISCTANVVNATASLLNPDPKLEFYLSNNTTLDLSDISLGYELPTIGYSDTNDDRSRTVTVQGSWGSGTKYILFVADADNDHIESNENNNVEYVQINISGNSDPDLIIDNITTNRTSVCPFGRVYTTTEVKNTGDEYATSNTILKYYLSTDNTYSNNDRFLGWDYVDGLDPNEIGTETALLRIPRTTLPGSYYILSYADRTNICDESNENNNVGYKSINVVACKK